MNGWIRRTPTLGMIARILISLKALLMVNVRACPQSRSRPNLRVWIVVLAWFGFFFVGFLGRRWFSVGDGDTGWRRGAVDFGACVHWFGGGGRWKCGNEK